MITFLSTLLLLAPEAHAISGMDYNGEDPYFWGCDDDAVTLETQYIGANAFVLLLYSPSCKTNWTVVTSTPFTRYLWAQLTYYGNSTYYGTGKSYEYSDSTYEYDDFVWTPMIYCPTDWCHAKASGYAKKTPSGTKYSKSTGWY